jgi:hypothetical protein
MTRACCLHNFYYVILNVRDLESHVNVTNSTAPQKTASGTENPVVQALHFLHMDICPKFPGLAGVSHYKRNEGFM